MKISAKLRPPKMKHIRHIKPEFFEHEIVNDLSLEAMLGWIGIWVCSDKDGLFEWNAKYLKHHIFPYREDIDFEKILLELEAANFIVKYTVDETDYGYSPTWHKHQHVGNREAASTFGHPAPPKA